MSHWYDKVDVIKMLRLPCADRLERLAESAHGERTGRTDRESSETDSRLNGTADLDADATDRRPVAFGRVPFHARSTAPVTQNRIGHRDRSDAVSAVLEIWAAEGVQATYHIRDRRMAQGGDMLDGLSACTGRCQGRWTDTAHSVRLFGAMPRCTGDSVQERRISRND